MTPRPRILVIDDDAVFAGVLARSLQRRGFEAEAAGSTAAALQALQRFAPTHAVLDLMLGSEDGLIALQHLLQRKPDLVVLLLTGYASIATAVEAIKRGAANYLCKPADADDVLTALLSEHADLDSLVPENPMSVDRLQWEHIQRVLAEHEGNISATARALGMHRRTLQRKLQKRPVRR